MTKTLTSTQRALVSILMTALFAASLLLAVMPTPARAASLTEPQIQAILGLLASFNADPSVVSNTEASLRGATPSTHATSTPPKKEDSEHGTSASVFNRAPNSFCTINHKLGRGDNEESVGALQDFLASQGFFTGSTTAFFGPMTEEALKHWQAAQGIATSGVPGTTGWGVFGPKTRSVIARLCNPSSHDDKNLRSAATSENEKKVPAPTCTLTADQSSVAAGTPVTLTWTSTNADHASGSDGHRGPSGSLTVTPTTTTVYQKTVFGPGGSAQCQATVTVTGGQNASTTPTGTVTTQMVMAEPDINVASVAVAVVQFPFSLAIDSLTNIFVELGIGQ